MINRGVLTVLVYFMTTVFTGAWAQNSGFSVELSGGAGMGWSEIEETFIKGAENRTYILSEGVGVSSKSLGVLVGRTLGHGVFTLLVGVEVQQTGGKYIFLRGRFFWNTDKGEWDIASGEIRDVNQNLLRLQLPVVIRADVGSGFQLSFSAFPSFNTKQNDKAWVRASELSPEFRIEENFGINGRFSLGLIKALNSQLGLSVSWAGDFPKREFMKFDGDVVTVSPAYQSIQLNLHINCAAFW